VAGPSRVVRAILIVHGIVTIAAALVLAVFPAAIPSTVGIAMEPDAYLLSYFLAAAEFGIGVLSIGAARLEDASAIRLIAVGFAVFHGATAILEVVHLVTNGVSGVLVANLVLRIVACAAFLLIALRSRRSPAAA
jgi:hypothetical protein